MSTTIQLKATAGAVIDSTQVNAHITPSETWLAVREQNLLLQFEQPASEYSYKEIEYTCFCAYVQKGSGTGCGIPFEILEAYDPSTVTWNTQPLSNKDDEFDRSQYLDDLDVNGWNYLPFTWRYMLRDNRAAEIIKTGILIIPQYNSTGSLLTTSAASTNKPYISVDFSDADVYLSPSGNIKSGYVNPHQDLTLKWSNVRSGYSMERPTQASAAFTWKETGGAENTTSLTTEQAITIPADTWSAGTSYQWKVDVTDNLGHTTTSGWYTLSTTAAAATPPTLEFPISTVVDGTRDVTFRWTNNGGENNTGTDLEFSTDGTSWGSPINLAAGVSSYTAMPGTLTSGTNYWRARAYNADSTAGSWTSAAIFTVISSPQAPYYEVTNSPRPTISWVSDEQQAFQVQMGDYDSGLIFGADQSFKCPVYLPNGSATVRVRVMNQYNLWSEWSGTQITIANSPGGTLPTLTAAAGTDVQLTWTAVPGALKYLVYRDGALIGETGETNVRYITADDLEVGSWSYSNKSASTTRCRSKELIPVATGTVISYAETTYDNYVGVLATTTSTTYRQSVNWTNGSGTLTITADSYMNLLLRTHSTPYTAFTPEDWNGTVTINTPEDMADKTFTDRYANGSVTYFVRAVLPGDNYAQSATVTVNVSVPCPMITALDGGWIELQYSTDPVHVVNSTHSQQVSMMVYSGHVYPVPEIAPHRQRSYQIQVAFRRGESGPFEALLGREVFLKDQYGAAIHGVIGTIAKAENRFYTVCSATLEEMEGAL